MNKQEREQLQAVLDAIDRKEDDCWNQMAYMDEHKFNYEKQAIEIRRRAYHECFREVQKAVERMRVDDEPTEPGVATTANETPGLAPRYFARDYVLIIKADTRDNPFWSVTRKGDMTSVLRRGEYELLARMLDVAKEGIQNVLNKEDGSV